MTLREAPDGSVRTILPTLPEMSKTERDLDREIDALDDDLDDDLDEDFDSDVVEVGRAEDDSVGDAQVAEPPV